MMHAWLRGVIRSLVAVCCVASAQAQYTVTILHNNDAESKIFNLGSGAASQYGGIARFKTMVDVTRAYYQGEGHGVVAISAGDSFLAGANFQASLDSGAPGSRTFYDALGLSHIGYDAVTIGNHEFDFGPEVLAEFITDAQTSSPTKFLSANLDFSGEAALQDHVNNGRIASSTIVQVSTSAGMKKIGIIGATTETLPYVSTPGNVVVNNVATAVNGQIADLKTAGVDLIILSSHLQGLSNEQALISQLNPGINLIIAGGGDELLANLGNPSPSSIYGAGAPASVADTGLIPVSGYNSTAAPNSPLYPIISTAADLGGNQIPIVTGRDNYSYLNRISLNVDDMGNVTVDPSSNPQRIASTTIDPVHGIVGDAVMQTTVVDPVANFISGLAATHVGQTSSLLERAQVRFRETNLGNLVADAFLEQSQTLAPGLGAQTPQVALVNGGGIRDFISAGTITRLDTFDVSPFGNLLTVVEDVTSADFKMLLENAVSKITDSAAPGVTPTGTDGRFAQVSGFSYVYLLPKQPLVLSSTGNIITPGSRIWDVQLDDGTWVVQNGIPLPGVTIDVATLNFLAFGGDQYFDRDYLSKDYFTSFRILGVSDQQALENYLLGFGGADVAADSRYDLFGDRRILAALPEPSSALLLLAGLGCAAIFRRYRARNSRS